MQWKLILSRAGAEALGLSDADLASLFDIARASARPAGAGDLCPRCRNHPNDSYIQLLEEEPADVPEQVRGRVLVICLCGTTYWYAAVHAMDAHQPLGQASVRAASAALTPKTGALQIEGQAPNIPEPLPPGVNNTLDVANQIASRFRPEHYAAIQALIDNSYRPLRAPRRWPGYYETRSSFTLPPFGPLKAP